MSFSKSHLNGIRLMIQAACSFSIMALAVKLLAQRIPSIEIVFFRSLIGLIIISALIKQKKVSFLGKNRGKLLLRGVSGFLALAAFFYTIPYLPLGTAVLLNYTAPFFVVILSAIFLKERTRLAVLLLTVISFTGVYLLMEGQTSLDVRVGLIGLLSAFLAGIAYVTIRSIKHYESPLTVIFYFTAIGTIGSACWMTSAFIWPRGIDWFYILIMSIGAFWGQMWLTISLRRAPAPLVTPFSYLAPLLSFIYGLLFWDEKLTPLSALGAILIISGGCLISYFGTKKKAKS